MFRKILLTYSFLFCIAALSAQSNGTISGYVLDKKSKGLVSANVLLYNSSDSLFVKGCITDSSGFFVLKNVSAGHYNIHVFNEGFQPYKNLVTIDLSHWQLTIDTVTLINNVNKLADVVVTSKKPPFSSNIDGLTINVNSNAFKTSTNVFDILKRSPGVRVDESGAIFVKSLVKPIILINNKRFYMSDDQLSNYLATLRPEQIESIDIITNPSAKYDSQYGAVINIHLKKDKELGLQGSIAQSVQINKYAGDNTQINLIYKAKKISYYANVGYSLRKSWLDQQTYQHIGSDSLLTTQMYSTYKTSSWNYNTGFDYDIAKNHSIQFDFNGNNSASQPFSVGYSLIDSLTYPKANNPFTNAIKQNNDNYSGNLVYTGTINKTNQITFASSYANFLSTQTQLQTITGTNPPPLTLGSFRNRSRIFAEQLDYSMKIGTGTLESGVKFTSSNIDNNTLYEQFINSQWEKDTTTSNIFNYKESSFGFYGTYKNKIKDLNYQVGLRGEFTNTTGNSITLDSIHKYNYFQLLPSLALQYTLSQRQSLSVSYTRRVSRPSFVALNPFIVYQGIYFAYGGNQYLLPTIGNSFSLSYTLGSFYSAINFGNNKDDIQQTPIYNPSNNLTIWQYNNLSTTKYFGIELNYPIKIAKWLTTQPSFKYYLNKYSVYYSLSYFNNTVNTSIPYIGVDVNNYITLPHNYNLSLSYYYQYGGGTSWVDLRKGSYFNFGIQKTYFNCLNVKASVNDSFNTFYMRSTSKIPQVLDYTLHNTSSNRYVQLFVSYNFGKSIYKKKNVINSANDEENRARR